MWAARSMWMGLFLMTASVSGSTCRRACTRHEGARKVGVGGEEEENRPPMRTSEQETEESKGGEDDPQGMQDKSSMKETGNTHCALCGSAYPLPSVLPVRSARQRTEITAS